MKMEPDPSMMGRVNHLSERFWTFVNIEHMFWAHIEVYFDYLNIIVEKHSFFIYIKMIWTGCVKK
jgi:hypothetical protein